VSVLAPEREILADRFQNGDSLGRLNDLVADGQGGAYFTAGGAYYVNRDGLVTTVTEEIRANGIMLSRDERTLYVTNREVVVAFDVRPDGSVTNRRNFGSLSGDCCADGMAIDAAGRLYVTASAGVHVFSPQGRRLGLIPTPRPATTVAFSGPDKTTLYAVGRGARGPDGNEYTTPDGVRNNAKTIYRISILAGGFKGRAK
jgi:gluconolactonase